MSSAKSPDEAKGQLFAEMQRQLEEERELFEEASRVYLEKVRHEIKELRSGTDVLSRMCSKDEWVRDALVKMILGSVFELDRSGQPIRFSARPNEGASDFEAKRNFDIARSSFVEAVRRWLEEDRQELVELALREIGDERKYDLRQIYLKSFSWEFADLLREGVRKQAKSDARIAAELFRKQYDDEKANTGLHCPTLPSPEELREALRGKRAKSTTDHANNGGTDEGGA